MPAVSNSRPRTDSDPYAWANFLGSMEGIPEATLAPTAPTPAASPSWRSKTWALGKRYVPGTACTLALTALAYAIVGPCKNIPVLRSLDPVFWAMLLGMVAANTLPFADKLRASQSMLVTYLLPMGIVCLGAGLKLSALAHIGLWGFALTLVGSISAIGLCLGLARLFGLGTSMAQMLGIGTAICGGSAIAALAPVIKAKNDDVVVAMTAVSTAGLLAMLAMPLWAGASDMSAAAFGFWAGAGIQQTPQVIAAAFAYDAASVSSATVVKLARICLLLPCILVMGFFINKQQRTASDHKTARITIPWFVIGFVALAALASFDLLPLLQISWPGWQTGTTTLDSQQAFAFLAKGLLAVSMAAIGLQTRLSLLSQHGPKPFIVAITASTVMLSFLYLLIHFLSPGDI